MFDDVDAELEKRRQRAVAWQLQKANEQVGGRSPFSTYPEGLWLGGYQCRT